MQPDPRISALLAARRPLRSLEFFPPKDETGLATLRETATALKRIEPDFVSVTYGAGGSTRERTAQACELLRRDLGYTVMPHLTCVGHSRDQLLNVVKGIHAAGFRNIMTLRGDAPKGAAMFQPDRDGFRYASDLVAFIKSARPELCLGVGGYPEGHPEATSFDVDLVNLKRKVDAGADFITTQLFFDNALYHRFVERCQKAGIRIPIIPGIMPVLSLKQIRRFTALCGASLPSTLATRLEQAGEMPDIAELVGIDWALAQLRELMAQGIPGYHLYILNRPKAALALSAGLAA